MEESEIIMKIQIIKKAILVFISILAVISFVLFICSGILVGGNPIKAAWIMAGICIISVAALSTIYTLLDAKK